MRQLLQNLVGNALKFTHPGKSPEVEIEAFTLTPAEPFPGMIPNATYLRILIRDRGIGFEQRHANRIFRPLQRLHPRSAYSGTGIGLAICRKIVHRHHGWILARSKPGEGAVFAVLLPLSQRT
jgi:signal transduction histidine kinase